MLNTDGDQASHVGNLSINNEGIFFANLGDEVCANPMPYACSLETRSAQSILEEAFKSAYATEQQKKDITNALQIITSSARPIWVLRAREILATGK